MKTLCCIAVLSVCLAVVMAKTKCEEERERELKSNARVKVVPNCDKNGDYEALQCFEGSSFCMCWRPDGSHITDTSTKIKTCACHAHRDRDLANLREGLVGIFVPFCEDSGFYAKTQCHPFTGYCWCSDQRPYSHRATRSDKDPCRRSFRSLRQSVFSSIGNVRNRVATTYNSVTVFSTVKT